ncbi:serine protease [Tropicibacter sp. Alg240-R139]|uniref:S1 family peptidase n=1 Tax=Tropicibacter sp. Alg240-R139 TaxID=2305991 RepID=UPI0013E0A2C9|nr:serine protease [Tropicibacter sp. Alg240-R139]
MRLIFSVWLLVALSSFSPAIAQTQSYQHLIQSFSAVDLTRADKRFLQAALAFEGHYYGLLDGDWGRLSREAMTRYSRQEFGRASEEWHMAALAFGFFDRFERDGWDMQYYPSLGLSVLLPMKSTINDPPTENFVNMRHAGSSLSISLGIHGQTFVERIHKFTVKSDGHATQPYIVRKKNFAVSSVTKADGSLLYTRSNFINGSWSTVMLSAQKRDASLLSAVSSSLTIGRAAQLGITPNGRLETAINDTLSVIEEEKRKERNAESPQPNAVARKPKVSGGSGSGFFVSDRGHVLTNAHVVDGCGKVLVDGVNASLIDTSQDFDLALLQANKPEEKEVAIFSTAPAKLNSDVTAVGFPYAGMLGGLNVTRGAVSSLKGVGGNATTMQVTAPVQSGNSGGPLLGPSGNVVGVVVSKLDAFKVAGALGDVPQNVNFAVRGEIAKLFLAQNGIDPKLSVSSTKVEPVTIAERAKRFTTFIECR